MFPHRSRHKTHPQPGASVQTAIIEPGSNAMRLLIAEVEAAQATVLGWSSAGGWASPRQNTDELSAICDEALVEAERAAQGRDGSPVLPDQVIVGLPASALRAGAWSVEVQRPRPDRPVEESELKALLRRALRLAVNRLRSGEPDASDWYLVEASPVVVTVDGRGVTDPVGFRGGTLGASVFAALTRLDVIRAWEEIGRQLEFSTLTLSATPLALAAGLPVSKGILIDIGGTTTDVIWCQNGRPLRVASLQLGGRALTDCLVERWSLSLQEAENLKAAYSLGELDEDARESVQDALWPALQDWLEALEMVLAGLSSSTPLPDQVHLIGGGSALPEMVDAVRALAWSQRLHFARYPQVSRLRPTGVPGVVNRTDKGRKMGDVSALALSAWAVKAQGRRDRPDLLLSELCQLGE